MCFEQARAVVGERFAREDSDAQAEGGCSGFLAGSRGGELSVGGAGREFPKEIWMQLFCDDTPPSYGVNPGLRCLDPLVPRIVSSVV